MVDLHVHSLNSDGTDTPSQIVEKACKLGLSAIALTDHNTIKGLDELNNASKGKIEAIAGIEISTATNNEEFHIIGLFVKPENYDAINDFLKIAKNNKIESNKNLVKNLCNAGYKISYDEIVRNYGNENFNRVAIANELIARGYIQSVQEAFSDLVSEERGFYIPPKRLDTFEAISFLSSINVLPVWAHPLKDTTFEKLDEIYLPKAKKCGLVAIETMHSSYTNEKILQAKALAEKYNLLQSGGSDYHGANKPNVCLGTGTNGNVNIDDSVLQNLKECL